MHAMLTRSRSRSIDSTPAEDGQSFPSSQSGSFPPEEDHGIQKKNRVKRRKGRGSSPDQWVCIISDSSKTFEGSRSSIMSLKDPRTNNSCQYLFKENASRDCCSEICEILKFSDEPRSWFIGNSIHTDGSLHICPPLDPLFLALPYFKEAAKIGKFTTLDVILEDHMYDTFRIITACTPNDQWANISEEKAVSGSKVFRYSKERTLSWLQKKVTALAKQLEKEQVYVGSGSQSSAFVRSSKQSDVTKDDYLSYACGMLCDYLQEDIAQEISSIYVNAESSKSKVERNGDLEPPLVKKARQERSEPLEDYSLFDTGSLTTGPAKVVSKQTVAQKSLAKIDRTGMKSLSSFFKKK